MTQSTLNAMAAFDIVVTVTFLGYVVKRLRRLKREESM